MSSELLLSADRDDSDDASTLFDVAGARTVEGDAPIISILLPTLLPWPGVSLALEALRSQTDAPPFEILLLDGHGAALPAWPTGTAIRWLRFPGCDPFVLRAEGVAAARGTIVAVSEDHCVAPAGWVASIEVAHHADSAPALVGATVNHPDSAALAIDRAAFTLTFAGQNPMRLEVRPDRLPVPTNLSFKRAALPPEGLAPGDLEYHWLARLRDARLLGVAPSVVLQHRQRLGWSSLSVHLASGRSYGASVRGWPWRQRLRWMLALPLLPLRLGRLVLPDVVGGAGGARAALVDMVCVATLILANVCGQLLGAAGGPGTSRVRL